MPTVSACNPEISHEGLTHSDQTYVDDVTTELFICAAFASLTTFGGLWVSYLWDGEEGLTP